MLTEPASQEFVAVINAHQALIQRVCRLYCSDADDRQDLFQEIVLQLWRAWPRYAQRPEAKLSTWLYRIALNVAITGLRQRTRRPAPERLGEQTPDLPETNESSYGADEFAQLYQAIEQLSEVDKAFVLLYLEGKSYEEMSDILGLTQNNVRVKMHRVQAKIRQLFIPAT